MLIVNRNELLRDTKTNLYYNHLSFFPPFLLLDNDGKFLLSFLCATVNLCCSRKEIIGYLISELKRTFPEELQTEEWNSTDFHAALDKT